MRTIQLKENMKSCVTQGQRLIPTGTIMKEYDSQLTWAYFKDQHGNVLIIMGYNSADWDKIKILTNQ